MTAIYIDRKGAHLDLDAGALAVRIDGEKLSRIPLAGVTRLVLRRAEGISLKLLGGLGERGIGLFVLGSRKGEPLANLQGVPHGDATVRLGQFVLARDPARVLALGRHAVKGKIAGALAFARAAMALRPDRRKPLFDAISSMEGCLRKLGDAADIDALRGLEGAAAAAFFRGYTSLFAPALGFVERNRRPPRDPVNACLSLAYTLLHGEAVQAAWTAGLDPFVGFLHAPLHGRESLACDLVETCRPEADRLVWTLFREGTLRADHFSSVDGACLMGKAGRAAFYEGFESFAGDPRGRLRRTSAALARTARAAWKSTA